MKNIVMQAIEATLRDPEGQDWLEGIYKKISLQGGSGSYLLMMPDRVELAIKEADWEIESIVEGDRPKVYLVARGFEGRYNMRSLEDMPEDAELVVAKYHGDKPQLGWVSDDYAGTPTDELRAVCGIDQDENGTILITALVGKLIDEEAVEAPMELLGETITVAEAKALGATYCKVVTTAAAQAAKEALAE